ncbi:MAG TPA: S53 family peptidase [Candidatus Acidoferrales bacterium]|nr:S53 family peptidase [Candidatus Acidoferrales bacterium]
MSPQKKRVELKSSARMPMQGASKIGPADLNEQIQVTLFLRRGSAPGEFPSLDEMGGRPPLERVHLTRQESAQKYGARESDIALIRSFASEFGLRVAHEEPGRRSVILSGTVAAFCKAFETELSRFRCDSITYRGRTGTLTIPSELDGVVEGVFGLDNRPAAKPHIRRRKKKTPADVGYSPLQVAQAYDFPPATAGTGQTIAILELGGGYNTADLNAFFSGLGITTPSVSAVGVDGGANSPTGDPSGPDGEVELDIEVAGAVAPAAKIVVYFAPNTDQGFLDALTSAVHDTNFKPSIVSISWGGPENTWTQQAMNSFSSACQDAATMGVTIFVASGDNGATDGNPNNQLAVDFPASSPFVIGCGGTRLTITGNSIASEQAWNELANNEGATGGGVSQTFALPSFQQNAKVPKAPNGFVGRGVPDVCGDADPTTGYDIIVDGQATTIGGTSAVAPLWAGLMARINQSLGTNVGYLNPLLYSAGVAATFHDITAGSNGGYNAGPGWDPCTGLGAPDGAALLGALRGQPASQSQAAAKK